MAGKHQAIDSAGYLKPTTAQNNRPPVFPGSRTDRAYAEGRLSGSLNGASGGIALNPHTSGTPEANAWNNGAFYSGTASEKLQTAVD